MSKSYDARVRRPLDNLIFFGLLTVLALTAIPFGTVDPFWEGIFEAAVFALTILWLFSGLPNGSWWEADHILLLPLFGLVVFAVLQGLPYAKVNSSFLLGDQLINSTISADPFESWRFSLKFLAVSLTLGILLRYTSNFNRMRLLIYLVIVVAVCSALMGLLKDEILGFGLASFKERLSTTSSYAQFDNRNHFAFLMEAAIGLVLGVSIADRRHVKRLAVYLVAGGIMWSAILLTHSRGAVVSLTAEVVLFFLLLLICSRFSQTGRRWRAIDVLLGLVLVAVITGAIGASVAFVGGEETVRRFELTPTELTHRDDGSTKLLRPQIWQGTIGLINANPLVGVGFGAFSTAIPRYLSASGDWTPEQAHNDYLELSASAGLIGILLALWFVLMLIGKIRRRLQQSTPVEIVFGCGAVAGLCGIAVHSIFDFGLHITINSLVCVALIVIAVKGFNTNLTDRSSLAQAA